MAIPNQVGSGFTNIQNIIGANQNNGLGNAIQNGVQGQVNQFNSGLDSSQQQFNKDIDSAKSSIDLGKSQAQTAVSNASNLGAGQSLDNTDYGNFNNFTGSSYSGPTQLNNTNQLQNQAGQIQNTADNTKSDSGRQGLLSQYVGQGQYTQGQQNLDNLLLNQTGGQQLKQTRQIASAVNPSLNNAENNASGLADQTQNYLTNSQTGVKNQAVSGYQGIGNAAQANYNNLSSTVPAQYNNDLALLNADNGITTGSDHGYTNQMNLTSSLANLLGITNGQDIYGTKGSDLATTLQGPQNLSLAGTTAGDKYAQYEALSKLGGNTSDIYQGSDPSTVGSYKGISADQNAVQNLLNTASQTYQNNIAGNNINTNYMDSNGYGNSAGGGLNAPGYLQNVANVQNLVSQDAANPVTQEYSSYLNGQLGNYLASIGQNRAVNIDDGTTSANIEGNSPSSFNAIHGMINNG